MSKSQPATVPVIARAQPNIALIKYWGKQNIERNIPAVGSLSITLDALITRTQVQFDASLECDEFVLNGQTASALLPRVSHCLDLLRALAGEERRACVESTNNFPTGAGLASSASGFAALVTASDKALGLNLPTARLAELAGRCSGSAARSVYGGFVEIAVNGGQNEPPVALTRPILAAKAWPLEVAVAITSVAAKTVGSTEGMERTANTSPYYKVWVESSAKDLEQARSAVERKDFDALVEVSEHSCLKLHALTLSAVPGLVYWNAATVELIHRVRELRAGGVPVFFTVDAGPQVKAICLPGYLDDVWRSLMEVPGVQTVLRSGLGEGARVIES